MVVKIVRMCETERAFTSAARLGISRLVSFSLYDDLMKLLHILTWLIVPN